MSDVQATTTGATAPKVKKVTGPTVQITLSGVQALLSSGKTRKEIAEHFGVSQAIMKRKVWNHPSLRGKKAMGSSNMEFIDDLGEAPAETVSTTVNAAPVATPVAEEAASIADAAPVAEQAASAVNDNEWR